MKSPEQRRSRREKVESMCFLLLETNNGSMSPSEIAKIMGSAFRFRMSVQRLSNIMRPHIQSGEITRSFTTRGNSIWHLAYRGSQETE